MKNKGKIFDVMRGKCKKTTIGAILGVASTILVFNAYGLTISNTSEKNMLANNHENAERIKNDVALESAIKSNNEVISNSFDTEDGRAFLCATSDLNNVKNKSTSSKTINPQVDEIGDTVGVRTMYKDKIDGFNIDVYGKFEIDATCDASTTQTVTMTQIKAGMYSDVKYGIVYTSSEITTTDGLFPYIQNGGTTTMTVDRTGWYNFVAGRSQENTFGTDAECITITYNANGGSGSVPSTQYKLADSNFIIPSGTPARSGYTFLGWSTSSSATSATYTAGSTASVSSNTVMYAVWEKDAVTDNPPTVYLSTTNGTSAIITATLRDNEGLAGYAFTTSSSTPSSWTSISGTDQTVNDWYQTTGYVYVWVKDTAGQTSYDRVYIEKVTYNANGGSGAPATEYKVDGTSI